MYQLGIKLAAGVFAVVVLAVWGVPRLKPLGQLIPNTQAMVVTTREILHETEGLQQSVGKVQENLSKVRRQEALLAEQQALMGAALAELNEQERLAGRAGSLLNTTLDKERNTAALTAGAARAAAASMTTVTANAQELGVVATAAGRIQTGSRRIDGQMDRLLGELNQSAINFEVIARLKEAVARALQRFGRWWP